MKKNTWNAMLSSAQHLKWLAHEEDVHKITHASSIWVHFIGSDGYTVKNIAWIWESSLKMYEWRAARILCYAHEKWQSTLCGQNTSNRITKITDTMMIAQVARSNRIHNFVESSLAIQSFTTNLHDNLA